MTVRLVGFDIRGRVFEHSLPRELARAAAGRAVALEDVGDAPAKAARLDPASLAAFLAGEADEVFVAYRNERGKAPPACARSLLERIAARAETRGLALLVASGDRSSPLLASADRLARRGPHPSSLALTTSPGLPGALLGRFAEGSAHGLAIAAWLASVPSPALVEIDLGAPLGPLPPVASVHVLLAAIAGGVLDAIDEGVPNARSTADRAVCALSEPFVTYYASVLGTAP